MESGDELTSCVVVAAAVVGAVVVELKDCCYEGMLLL